MRFFRIRWLLALAWGFALIGILNAGTGFWTLKRLEKKAGAPIHGTFLPHLFQPVFNLKNARLSWQNRFEILSGSVRVQYDPVSVLVSRRFRIQVAGSDLEVRFLKELALSGGRPQVKIDTLTADFAVSNKKAPEIFRLEIHSPEMEFRFAEKDANQVKAGGLGTEN